MGKHPEILKPFLGNRDANGGQIGGVYLSYLFNTP